MSATPRRKRRRRWILLWIVLVIVVGFIVNVLLALRPAALEARLRRLLDETLACSFEFDSFRASLTRGFEIRGLRLTEDGEAESKSQIARVERIRIAPDLGAALTGSFRARRVELETVDLSIVRGEDGEWNLQRILKPRPAPSAEVSEEPTAEAVELPQLMISGCRIQYDDRHTFPRPVEQEVPDLWLSLRTTEEAGTYAFEGEIQQEYARRLTLGGVFRLQSGTPQVEARLSVVKLDLTRPLERYLDAELAAQLRSLRPQGLLDAEGTLEFDARHGFRLQELKAQLLQAELSPEQFPVAARGLSGELLYDAASSEPARLSLAGEAGGGPLTAQADIRLDPTTLRLVGWSGWIEAESLPVDPRQAESCGPVLRDVLASFQPRGSLAIRVAVDSVEGLRPDPADLQVKVTTEAMDFTYDRFAYPLTEARFTALVKDGWLRVEPGARVRCGEGEISLTDGGRFQVELRRGGAVEVDLALRGLVLDERVRDAIPAASRHFWDDLRPGGRVDASVRVTRESRAGPDSAAEAADVEPPVVLVEARPIDGRIKYRAFPYEIHSIDAKVIYSSREQTVQMLDIVGRNGDNEILGAGEIDLGQNPAFRLDLTCDRLTLDEELLAALPEVARRVLVDFRFEGHVKLEKVGIDSSREDSPVIVLLEDIHGSVSHRGFPYRLEIAGGRFEYRGLQDIRLRDWRTPTDFRPAIVFGGDVNARRKPFSVRYQIGVEGLRVDPRLKEALPLPLRNLVHHLGLEGEYSGDLEVEHSLFENDLASSNIVYRATGVRSENAGVDFGVQVSDMDCVGNFEGSLGGDAATIHSGDVLVRSGRFNRLRLKDGRINFVFGRTHPLVADNRRGKYLPPVTFRLPEEFTPALEGEKARSIFQMSVTSDDFYGGATNGFIFVDVGPKREFGGYFVSRDIDVKQASRDVFSVESDKISGRAGGKVLFRGPIGSPEGIRGQGEGRITDARLAELPIFFNILRLVNMNFDTTKGTRFSEISLPYRIEGGKFLSKQIEIESSVMTLSGEGSMDFSGGLDLELQPSFLPVEIPGVDEVFGVLKKVLSEIHVGGDLADPKVDFKTAGGLLPIRIGGGGSGDESKKKR